MKLLAEARKSPAADSHVALVFEDRPLFSRNTSFLRSEFTLPERPFTGGIFTGKVGQTLSLFSLSPSRGPVIIAGLGKCADLSLETIRRAAALAARIAQSNRVTSLAFLEIDPDGISSSPPGQRRDIWKAIGTAIGEGVILGLYKFDKYITKEEPARGRPEKVIIGAAATRATQIAEGLTYAKIVCAGTILARDLANAPGNEIYPASLARLAKAIGRREGFSVQVFDDRKIRLMGMGGLAAVGQGSANPPRLIVLDYNRRMARKGTVVLVGKGITFDSGGISIKPSANMSEMKMDMSGAAAVLATVQTTARLRLGFRILGIIPAAENLPGGRAYKPGDILQHYNGKTSEIDNTDAEGRLVLADALSYAGTFKPDVIIDLATLTGACVVALGHAAAGMLGTSDDTMQQLIESGTRTNERVWQLPMFEEYESLIKSDVADVKNVGGRWAGAITAAFFLKAFVGDHPWVHLDIAGTASLEEPTDYTPRGASGYGVRLLSDYLIHRKKQ